MSTAAAIVFAVVAAGAIAFQIALALGPPVAVRVADRLLGYRPDA